MKKEQRTEIVVIRCILAFGISIFMFLSFMYVFIEYLMRNMLGDPSLLQLLIGSSIVIILLKFNQHKYLEKPMKEIFDYIAGI